MKTLYFHVGPHKTGTTALQKFLLDNQAMLHKQNLLYPKRYVQIFGHHSFRKNIADRAITQDDIDFFASSDSHFLLSSEDFISLSKEDFEYLKQCFEDIQIKVIYTWRRASLKLFSIWQEVIKHGGTVDFFNYYHTHLARPSTSQMLSPDLKLGMFAHVFGKQNVLVLDYEASQRSGSLIPDFLSMMNIPWSDKFKTDEHNKEAKNKSMHLTDVEIVRGLNIMVKQQGKASTSNIRTLYMKHKPEFSKQALEELENAIKANLVPLNIGNYFIDVRSEKVMTQKFAANIHNYSNSVKVKKLHVANSEWLLIPGVREHLSEILTRIMSN